MSAADLEAIFAEGERLFQAHNDADFCVFAIENWPLIKATARRVAEMREKANAVLENIGVANWYAGTPANQCQNLLAEATRALQEIVALAPSEQSKEVG